jgi:hypothetical protein
MNGKGVLLRVRQGIYLIVPLLLLVLVISFLAGGAADSLSPSGDLLRVAEVYRGHPIARSSCGGDTCTGVAPDVVRVRIPDEMGPVELSAELALQYRTSAGDAAEIVMQLRSAEGRRGVAPTSYVLRAGGATSTSVTWAAGRLVPGRYRFAWGIQPRSSSNASFDLVVSKAVLVVEAVRI